MQAIGAILLAWFIGVLGVAGVWPGTWCLRRDIPLILSLGFGLGLAGTSAILFFSTVVSSVPIRISAALDVLFAVAFAYCIWLRRRGRSAPTGEPVGGATWVQWVAASLFAQAAFVAAVVSARAYAAEPFGLWDGWAIWNLHARFLYFGREGLNALLRSTPIAWSHPDYPWLLPASVARAWTYAGVDAPFASGLISVLFAAATVALLVAAVARLRGPTYGFLAGLILLGTPFFVTFSAAQYADIPLGFFILAASAAIVLGERRAESRGLPFLAGCAVGAAAWTKNEGLLFAVVAALCCFVGAPRRHSGRWLGAFYGGMLVALMPVLCFKFALSPPGDVVSASIAGRLGQLVDGTRHGLILGALRRDLARFGDWGICPYVAMALPLLVAGRPRLNRLEWTVAGLVALTFAGYYCVYLLTPRDLAWQLRFSLVRLLLQLWPSVVLLWALCLKPGGTDLPLAFPIRASWRRGAFVLLLAANLGVALLVARTLSRQLAVDELVRSHVSGADISVGAGEGWFAPESEGRDIWSWSRGRSDLWVLVGGAKPVAVGLSFRMRGLGSRVVTARIGDHTVWRARVGEDFVAADLPDLTLQPGLNSITFESDLPGVAESQQPDARLLTFAIYDLQVR